MDKNAAPDALFLKAYEAALAARPTPIFSGYEVRAAVITTRGNIIAGSNHEYSMTRAIHSEESIVSSFLDMPARTDDERISRIIFIHEPDDTGKPPLGPCGNCRDVLAPWMAKDAEVMNVSPEDPTRMQKAPWSSYVAESFTPLPLAQVPAHALRAAQKILEAKPSKWVPKSISLYAAAFYTKNEVVAAGLRGDVAYHPRLPIDNTIARWSHHSSHDAVKVRPDGILIVSRGVPHVPYLDRQHALEFDSVTGDTAIQIILVELDAHGKAVHAWKTDTDEWLPHAFSPKTLTFGQD